VEGSDAEVLCTAIIDIANPYAVTFTVNPVAYKCRAVLPAVVSVTLGAYRACYRLSSRRHTQPQQAKIAMPTTEQLQNNTGFSNSFYLMRHPDRLQNVAYRLRRRATTISTHKHDQHSGEPGYVSYTSVH